MLCSGEIQTTREMENVERYSLQFQFILVVSHFSILHSLLREVLRTRRTFFHLRVRRAYHFRRAC